MTQIIKTQKGKKIDIKVLLDGESKPREIGIFFNGVLYIQRKREKHTMYKYNDSYGFNEEVIRTLEGLKAVQVKDDVGVYYLPKEVIIEAMVAHPKGYDRQFFVPIITIEEYQTEGVEK